MDGDDWIKEHDAPEGFEWVCTACGRHGTNRARLGDSSCFTNSVLGQWNIATSNWDLLGMFFTSRASGARFDEGLAR